MFEEDIKRFSRDFLRNAKEARFVRVITHFDADGISSGCIIAKLLEDMGLRYHISIFKQIYSHNMEKIGKGYKVYIFTDLGSGKISQIMEFLEGKKVYILDHHKPQGGIFEFKNIRFLNPFLYGIDGDREISSSGIAYLFSKEIDPKIEEVGYLAVVGMFGDMQDPLFGMNKKITEDLVKSGIIGIERGLKIFGRTYKPIHKALAYSFDPFLPGITGNEENAIKILKSSKIEYKIGNVYKTVSDLKRDEERELISNIIIKAVTEGKRINPKEIIGNIYLVKGKRGIFSDCREIATLLNAFGKLGKGSLAILLVLGKIEERKAYEVLEEYSRKISLILRKIDEGMIKIEEIDNVVVIHGKNKIPEEFVGTITSIISRNYPKKLVVGYGLTKEGKYKFSLRSCSVDCESIVRKIVNKYKIEGGGHKQASGMEVEKRLLQNILDEIKRI